LKWSTEEQYGHAVYLSLALFTVSRFPVLPVTEILFNDTDQDIQARVCVTLRLGERRYPRVRLDLRIGDDVDFLAEVFKAGGSNI
jgi:hypothetical protein